MSCHADPEMVILLGTGLSETASIEFPRLKTLSARTREILAAGNLQMTAVVTNEPPVGKRRHRSEFVVLHTVWAPHYRHGHCRHSPGNPLLAGYAWPDSNRELLQECKCRRGGGSAGRSLPLVLGASGKVTLVTSFLFGSSRRENSGAYS
jgi:hypothetical protein